MYTKYTYTVWNICFSQSYILDLQLHKPVKFGKMQALQYTAVFLPFGPDGLPYIRTKKTAFHFKSNQGRINFNETSSVLRSPLKHSL